MTSFSVGAASGDAARPDVWPPERVLLVTDENAIPFKCHVAFGGLDIKLQWEVYSYELGDTSRPTGRFVLGQVTFVGAGLPIAFFWGWRSADEHTHRQSELSRG